MAQRALALILAVAGSLAAQYTISAMAGYIHFAEGEVWLEDRAIAPKPEDFLHVMEGRKLRTGQGRAELLLVPGSFVRMGSESEVEMVSAGLASAVLRLHSGSVMVDLQTQFEDDGIAVLIGNDEVRFRKSGLYRLDATEENRLSVMDGRARVTMASGEQYDVKSGRAGDLAAGLSIKLGKPEPDSLDDWSRERHDELGVLAENARKERWEGMSEDERNALRMILTRPSDPPMGGGAQPRMPPANSRPSR